LKDISRQLSFSPIYVSAATRELWWMSQEWLELKWGLNRSENNLSVWDALYGNTP
jgi:hypothetical protein